MKKLDNPRRTAELNPLSTLAEIGLREGSVMCDIGAGTGIFTFAAIELTKNIVYAVDTSDVMLEGSLGHELIVDKSAENILLVAGGIGVTPFLPILEDLVSDSDFKGNVHFIYGVNKESELLYADEIQALIMDNNNFKFTPVVAFDDNYKGEKGFVTNVIEKLSLDNTKIYVCGSPPMIAGINKLLDEMKFDKSNLFGESA